MFKSTILKNTSYLGISTVCSYFLLFFSTVYIARILGPENFGKIAFAQTVAIYISLLTDGMKIYGVRVIAGRTDKKQLIINENEQNIFSTSIILLLLSVIVVAIIPNETNIKLLTISLIASSSIMASFYIDWIYQSQESLGYVATANLLKNLIYVILIFFLLSNIKEPLMVGLATLAASIIASFFLIKNLKKINLTIKFQVNLKKLFAKNENFNTFIVLGLTSLRNQIFYSSVIFILGLCGNHLEAGYFNAAFKVVFFIGSLGNIYMISVFPRICNYCKGDKKDLQVFVEKSTKLLAYCFIPLGFGTAMLSNKILVLVYGKHYTFNSNTFGVLLFSIIVMLFSYNYSSVLIGYGKQNIFIKILSSVFLLNVISLSVFSKFLNAQLAAYIALCSESLVLLLLVFTCKKEINLSIRFDWFYPLAGSLVMVIVINLLNLNNLILTTIVGAITYITFIMLFAKVKLRELIKL